MSPFDIKIFIVVISNLLLIAGDSLYIRGVIRRQIVPHSFSWLVWSGLTSVAFAAQLAGKGGPGTFISAMNALLCLTIFFLSLKYGVKKFAVTDWICLTGALMGIIAWQATNNPLWATVIVSITDLLAIVPTYRKIYLNPYQDSPLPFSVGLIGWSLSLFAITNHTLTTVLFPATIILNDTAYVLLIFIRRKFLSNKKQS